MGRFCLLYVSMDCIGILRELQGQDEPDPVECAAVCERSGCDGITVQLREDRRHVQDRDLFAIKERIRGKLNLEIALSDQIIGSATKTNPDKIVIVSEKRSEYGAMTGLDLKTALIRIKDAVQVFHDHDIQVSLCIEPDIEAVELSKDSAADFIQIHTGAYGRSVYKDDIDREIGRIYSAANHAVKAGLKVSAGHGLTYKNIVPVLKARALEEVNIGHSIISRAVIVGLSKAIEEMLDILD